jgi:hypothetical protein
MEEPSEVAELAPDPGDATSEAQEYAAFVARAVQNGSEPDEEDPDEWGEESEAAEPSEEESTPKEQATEASTEGEGESEAEAVQASLDDSLKAALTLDGFSEDQIARELAADPDGLVKHAQRCVKRQRDVSQAFQELAQLKKQAEATPGAGQEAEQSAQPSTDDLDKLAQPLVNELGEETAGAVVELIRTREAKLQAELQALKDAQAATQTERVQEAVSAARQSLRERFPQLADDDSWNKVIERGQKIEGGYADMGGSIQSRIAAVLGDAAGLVFGSGVSGSADATPRRNGKGPTPPRRKSPSKPVSAEQREFERWKAKVESGR